jgi:putative oxidoreductase
MSATESGTLLLGRVLLSAIFISGGWGKLLGAAATQAAFGKMGLPLPVVAWGIAVIVELAGGVAILLGLLTRVVAVVLAIWCVATALIAHTNFAERAQEINFFKNMAMTGGFLVVAVVGAGAWSLDAWLGQRRRVALG